MSINDEWKKFLEGLAAPKVKTKDVKTTTPTATPTGAARQGAFVQQFDALIANNEKKAARNGG